MWKRLGTEWKIFLGCVPAREYEGIMAEYNKLTKRLLTEGYTAENYPKDKVHIAHGCYSRNGNPLDNIYGGFEYNRIYCDSFIYKTGCGMHVKGISVLSSMGFMGEEWCHENDNPVVRCPYDIAQCPKNDPRLYGENGGGLCIQCWCVCHRTDEAYEYENSIEQADKERSEEMERKYQEYSDAHNGRVCRNHMYYDERTREWHLSYEPKRCAHSCYAGDGYCPILGRQLSQKKGNVFYDVKTSVIPKQKKQISLFDVENEMLVTIEKGIRVFDKPVSMDICEAFVKVQADDISYNYRINHSMEKFMNPTWEFEILNIRVESKPSRDLMQDLQDIQAGIHIFHASDAEKRIKENKKEKRQQAQQKKIEKLEKKIIEVGYCNLEPYSIDKIHADKWLGMERIDELEKLRKQKLKEEQEKPVQLSLFDMM